MDLDWIDDVVRAKRAKRLTAVLSRGEANKILNAVTGVNGLLVKLLYGTGMRLMEVMRLRIQDIDFKVTPVGRDGSENIALIIILIVMIYAVTLISFFGKITSLSILTGMMMVSFGIWIIRNGMVIYRDNLTNYFGYVTIAIGAVVALWAAIEWINEMF